MPPKSSIKRLDKRIQAEIYRLYDVGCTLDEVLDHLRALGVSHISRSALGRDHQQYAKAIARVRESREIAEALVREFGDGNSEPKAMRANIELAQALVSKLLVSRAGDEKTETKEVTMLTRCLESLGRASKADIEMITKIREQTRKEVELEVRAKVKALGTAKELKGLTDEELEKRIAELAGQN